MRPDNHFKTVGMPCIVHFEAAAPPNACQCKLQGSSCQAVAHACSASAMCATWPTAACSHLAPSPPSSAIGTAGQQGCRHSMGDGTGRNSAGGRVGTPMGPPCAGMGRRVPADDPPSICRPALTKCLRSRSARTASRASALPPLLASCCRWRSSSSARLGLASGCGGSWGSCDCTAGSSAAGWGSPDMLSMGWWGWAVQQLGARLPPCQQPWTSLIAHNNWAAPQGMLFRVNARQESSFHELLFAARAALRIIQQLRCRLAAPPTAPAGNSSSSAMSRARGTTESGTQGGGEGVKG